MDIFTVFGLLMICGFTPCVGIFTITPQNEAKYENETVELACEFDSDTYEFYWSECLNGKDDCSNLFRDGEALPGANPPPHYSVANRTISTGKRYDLVITGVQTTDGGKFRCGNSVIRDWAYAEVIVLVPGIDCSSNLTFGSEVELGDNIYLSSETTSHGRWLPVAKFKYQDDTELTGALDESSGDTARQSVVLEAVKDLQNQSLSAEWYFNNVTGTTDDEANNTPIFPPPDHCSFDAITVYYAPENITIQHRDDYEYHEGDTITCTVVDGHPTPSLKWINMNDTSDVTDCGTNSSCVLTVPVGMIGETLMYQCQACNNYFSNDHCDSDQITFHTITYVSDDGLSGAVIFLIVTCSAVAAADVILLSAICWMKKQKKDVADRAHKMTPSPEDGGLQSARFAQASTSGNSHYSAPSGDEYARISVRPGYTAQVNDPPLRYETRLRDEEKRHSFA